MSALTNGTDVYRIGGGRRHPGWAHRWHVDRWFRSWQAEREGMMWACRAWTSKGAERKLARWFRRGTDIRKHERRYGPKPQLWERRANDLQAVSR